jgi:hypothetical protein
MLQETKQGYFTLDPEELSTHVQPLEQSQQLKLDEIRNKAALELRTLQAAIAEELQKGGP